MIRFCFRLLSTLIVVLYCALSQAQVSSLGGFDEGWQSYDQSWENGLGIRDLGFDYTGVRSIDSIPDIGIHPRVFFGPNEVIDLKSRWLNTASGRSVAATIHAYTTLIHKGYGNGGTYNHNATYGSDEYGNRYIDNAGKWNSNPQYYKLINEDETVWNDESIKRRHITAAIMALEALECLVFEGESDPDTGLDYDDRALDLAKAMTFWAGLALEDDSVTPDNYNLFGGSHMAMAYDLSYNAMTLSQRDSVRLALAKIISDTPRHGGHLSAYAATSNWAGLNSFEIITNLAIEGEVGYSEYLTTDWVKAYHNFINYGWYPSGAGYEGLGKNYMFVTTGIALAKRGFSVLGHPYVKAYGTQFLPAITQPFGHGFTSYDVWGGSGHDDVIGGYKMNASDAIGLKWIFPHDAKVDLLWRNYIERSYNNDSDGYVYQQVLVDDSYANYLLLAGIFALDYDGTVSRSTQTLQHSEENYIAPDRGLAVIKSGKDSLDLAVQFHCRQDMGGHTHGDKLDFTLSAMGRIWIRKSYGGSQFQPTWFHSAVLVDDKGMGVGDPDGDKCRQPGTLLEWTPDDQLTKVAGDATYAYTYEWHWSPRPVGSDHPWLGNNGWSEVTETWNDFQMIPVDEPQYNIPFYDYAHWHQQERFERMVKKEYNPMERVKRTVGMFKGDQPFVIITDDLQKDNNIHNYKWLAQIARDLTIESTEVNLNNTDYKADIILKEPDSEGDRRLLVRVLNNEGYDGSNDPGIQDTLTYTDYFSGISYNANPNYVRPRLIIESNSVAPEFKILLFPHRVGDELPTTHWNDAKDTLQVNIDNEVTEIAFELVDGRTEFGLVGDCGLVTNTYDSGRGSLRSVLDCAMSGDTIKFSIALRNQTISLTSEPLIIDKDITILADSGEHIEIKVADPIDANMNHGILVNQDNTVELRGLTIIGGYGPHGSAISNSGTLILTDMIIKSGTGNNINSSIHNTANGTFITRGNTIIE